MAPIALILGSVFGFFSAVVGWVGYDMTLMSGMGLYCACAVGTMIFAVSAQSVQDHLEAEPTHA